MRRVGTDEVVVTLSYSEALVAFELLHRWEETGVDRRTELFADQSEQRVLWDLSASLEPIIDEVFSDTYAAALAAARADVRDSEQ